MSAKAYAVIGANWGDEGKGLAVDALTNALILEGNSVTVVRSNGGAQAGHGVERPEGGRHVFHHIGAGTFCGAETHLSRFFVAHPMVLQEEIMGLRKLASEPQAVTIDPRAPVTTPWDMAVNQAVEIARAGGRHGSTGLGFGETIERHEAGFEFVAADLWADDLRSRLELIRDEWVPARLRDLSFDVEESPLADILCGRVDLIAPFLEDCEAFRNTVSLRNDADLGCREAVLFEGAQGLQLDMDFGVFPHVTRSHTGLRNMLSIAAEADIGAIKVHYMTRAYATRHGAGPLPHEVCLTDGVGRIDWAQIVDETNAPNDWQGVIREAALDADLLRETIRKDIALSTGTGVTVTAGLGVTCIDQILETGEVFSGGECRKFQADEIPDLLSEVVGLPVFLTSRGPTRASVWTHSDITEVAA
jgi:adenylosuccinate synthase